MANVNIFIEDTSGERFECEVPLDTELSTLAADFFGNRGWPTTDNRGRRQRAVVELVDPDNPERTKRLNGEQTVEDAGLFDGAVLRIFPESINEQVTDSVRRGSHPIFRSWDFEVETDLCFVLMPFGKDDLEVIYRDHVLPTLRERALRVRRADDIYGVRPIIEDIWSEINRARLIVAELTERNSNVFYEVGICHTLGKEVIMLTQTMDDVPFDLRHLRVICYKYTPRGCALLEQMLAKTVQAILGQADS